MKEIIVGARTDTYDAPVLFPKAPYLRPSVLRDYVERRLVELAQTHQLHVTELMNQPGGLPDLVGMIILGREIAEDHTMRVASGGVPPALQGYKVRVRSIDGTSTIKWKVGKKRIGTQTQGDRTQVGAPSNDGGDYYPSTVEKQGDYWLDSEETDTELPLASAWLCLRQAGKWCRPCKRTTARPSAWKYEEVFEPYTPRVSPADDPPTPGMTEDLPRGRGRPRAVPSPA